MKYQLIAFFLGIYLLTLPIAQAADPQAVYAAHLAWKAAFESADLRAADAIWSHEPDAILVTIFEEEIKGWERIQKELRKSFEVVGESQITASNWVITAEKNIASATMDYEWSILPKFRFKTTEYYRLEEGRWKLYINDATGKRKPLRPDDEAHLREQVKQTQTALAAADLDTLAKPQADDNFIYVDFNGTVHDDFDVLAIGKDLAHVQEVHLDVVYLIDEVAQAHLTLILIGNKERKIELVYENFELTKIDFAPKPLSIQPRGKLATTWGAIKREGR